MEYISIRWETINRYLEDIGFPNKLGKDDFIPENIFYRLAMKAKNETAEKFQALVADEIIPSIRKNGIYATDNVIDEILNNPDFGIELLTKLKQERQARVEAERKNAILTHVNKTYTMTEIAKELNLKSAIQLNKLLADKKFNTVSMELGFFTHHTAVWDMKKSSKKSSTMVRLFITGE